MKFILSALTIIFLFSCKNPAEKTNDRIKPLILKKNREITKNFKKYQNDIVESEFGNLLNIDRLKTDRNNSESKTIIKNAESIFSEFNTQNKTLATDLLSLLDSLQPSKQITETEINSMKNEFKKNIELMETNFKSDSTALSINKQILSVLEKCKYEINGEKLEFEMQDIDFAESFEAVEINRSVT